MKKQYITNKAGERIFPYTHLKAVLDDNGNSLDTLLALLASPTVGTTAERNGMILNPSDVGFQFFDITLGKPVYAAHISDSGTARWVDATGNAMSYEVTYNLSNLSASDPFVSAEAGNDVDWEFQIQPNEGYTLPDGITVKMNNVSLIPGVDYSYTPQTGMIQISTVTGPIVITAAGVDPNDPGSGTVPGPSHEQQEPAWVFGDELPATLSDSESEEDWQLGDELPATLN